MTDIFVTVLGGALDGKRYAIPEAELVALDGIVDEQGGRYRLTPEQLPHGEYALHFVADSGKSSRRSPRRLWPRDIDLLKPAYLSFLRHGYGFGAAAEAAGAPYNVMLGVRKRDACFAVAAKLAYRHGRRSRFSPVALALIGEETS